MIRTLSFVGSHGDELGWSIFENKDEIATIYSDGSVWVGAPHNKILYFDKSSEEVFGQFIEAYNIKVPQ